MAKIKYSFVICCLIVCILKVCAVSVGFTTTKISPQPLWNATHTDRLRQDLLLNYDKFARPAHADQKITVTFAMTIRHIDLNELKSTLTVHCWLKLSWNDMKLQWNSSDYGGITQLHLAEHEIWQPDIYVYNSATSVPINYYSHTHFIAMPNGHIIWVPAAQFNIPCNLDLRYWPFDSQKCEIMFGSWTYHGDMIDIQLANYTKVIEMDVLIFNTEWTISNSSAVRRATLYECCSSPYISIDVSLWLKRISPSYKALVITPAFVIMILTLLNFWLPPQAGEKVIINATTAVIITVFMLYFTTKLPAMGNHTPLIVLFYSNCLYLVSFSMIGSVIVITLSRNKHVTSIPWVIKQPLTGKFGQILGLDVYIRQSSMISHQGEEMRDHHIYDDNIDDNHMIRACLRTGKPSVNHDWVLLAAAIDRVMFILYFFIFVIFAIVYAV